MLLLLLAGCEEDEASGVKGSPSDVKTPPGVYDGYEIVDECRLSYPYGVRGTGSRWYDDVAPEDPGRADALVDLGNSVLMPALADVESIGGAGFGTSCSVDESGVTLMMSDWRDVDDVFAVVGQVLAEGDLREEVSILVAVAEPD